MVVGGVAIVTVIRAQDSYYKMLMSPTMLTQSGGIPVMDVGLKLQTQVGAIKQTIWQKLEKQLKQFSAVAYRNTVKSLFGNVANRVAQDLAAGMTGQKPAFTTNFKQFLEEEADGALGDYLNNTLGKMWGKDLCQPLQPLAKVQIEGLAKSFFTPTKPSCRYSKIRQRVKDLGQLKLNDLVEFSAIFNPGENDLGAALSVITGGLDVTQKARERGMWIAEITQGFKPVTNVITNEIRSPAQTRMIALEEAMEGSFQPYLQYTGYAAADAIGIFSNTLVSKLLEHYLTKGIYQGKPTSSGGAYGPSFGIGKGLQSVKEQFANLARPDYNFGGPVDVLDNLSCNTENQFSCTIDIPFRTALEKGEHLTVDQAKKQGFLHGYWPVGYRADKSGGTDGADKSIYSYRSLVILRKYRILPVGWELAAEYYLKYDRSGKALTLDRLMADYDKSASPYYRLVDPGWVLKAPETTCEKEGPGELSADETVAMNVDLNNDGDTNDDGESRELVIRQDYCADERSCISESENGEKCNYYGYCTKEKPIWRIDGDECQALYNTCRTYINSEETEVNYLTNTLSGREGLCTPENAGCREYCDAFDPASQQWQCKVSIINDPTNLNYGGPRKYLDSDATEQTCSVNEAGCSEFIRMSANLSKGSNWIPNSSFEQFEEEGIDDFAGTDFNSENHKTDKFATFSGSGTITGGPGDYALTGALTITIDTGRPLGGRVFIFSLIHKNKDLEITFTSDAASGRSTKMFTEAVGEDFRSVWKYDFLESPDNAETVITIAIPADTIDDLQLVESENEQIYSAYGELNKVNLKKAPIEYSCDQYSVIRIEADKTVCESAGGVWRGDIQKCVAGGSAACLNYALSCDQGDANCQFYTPTSYKGVKQPGVIGLNDLCPKECVGYRSYLEQPSFFEPLVPANRNPVYLIATTARTCSASENGCEEFTNLSEGSEGERKEYYTNLRACVLSDPNNAKIKNYYSWASSDEAGNQLRNWTLLQSSLGNFPCTNPVTALDGAVSCNDTDATKQICTLGAVVPADNPAFNPDCVEFINTDGVPTWAKFSKVVFASEDCAKLRRTYVPATGTEIYSAITSLSQSCSAGAVACREYKGSASNNIKVVLDNNFEDKTNQGWTGGEPSSESIVANGTSLLSTGNTITKDAKDMAHQGRAYKLSFWAKAVSGTPTVKASFVGGASNQVFGRLNINGNLVQPMITKEWGKYTVDLAEFTTAPAADETLQITADSGFYLDNIVLTETNDDLYLIKDSWQTPTVCDEPSRGAMLDCEAYKDQGGKEWYAKSFSKICYDYAVGCEAMIDTANSLAPFEKSYNLGGDSRDDVITPADKLAYLVYDDKKSCGQKGCAALGLIEPNRDRTALTMSFSTRYLVINPDNFSNSLAATTLSNPLCLSSEVWCDEFQPGSDNGGTKENFKNPSIFTCDYRAVNGAYGWYQTGANENCPGNTTANFGYCFSEPKKSCASESDCNGAPCLKERRCLFGRSLINSKQLSNLCDVDADCADYSTFREGGLCSDWTAVCPSDEHNCREYQDPSSPEDCDNQSVNGEIYPKLPVPPGRANADSKGKHCGFYYYKKVAGGCESINPAEGCIGFHEAGAGDDVWFSTKRCRGDLRVSCESDSECVSATGGNIGPCTDRPPAASQYQQENNASQANEELNR